MSFYFGEKTHEEIAEYIEKNAVVILPVGTTEEHGSHLPVETDAIIATEFGRVLGEACEEGGVPVLVMRTIYFGFSMGIVRKWPGCPNVEPEVFTAYIYNIVNSLVEMGFKKIVMLDCHGNHDCLLRTVMRKIADVHGVYAMTLNPFSVAAKKYNEIKRDPEGDIHGGEYETSCVLAARPELVHTDKYTNVDAIRCNSKLRGPVSTWGLQRTKTGLFGDPTYALPETGKAIFEELKKEGFAYMKAYYQHDEQSV